MFEQKKIELQYFYKRYQIKQYHCTRSNIYLSHCDAIFTKRPNRDAILHEKQYSPCWRYDSMQQALQNIISLRRYI